MGWTTYVDYLIGRRLGDVTISRYLRWVRDADEWLTERGSSLDEATATEIRAWSDVRVVASHACRGQAAAALRHYWDHVDRARPPVAIVVPQPPEYACRAIEPAQARDVVKVAVGWWPEGTAVLAGMYLALRRFEIASMEWARFSDDLAWYTVTGKRAKTAELPVHDVLAGEVARRRRSGWLFPGRYEGRHVVPATIGLWVAEVGQAAGITHLEPHELRHTAIATTNDNLGDLRAAQTFARHSKPATTSIYTRTKRKRLREVSDSLDYLG